jgi:hypothetical protein
MPDETPAPKPKPDADALAHRLKQKLSKERPRPWRLVLGTMLVSIVLLGLLAWWMYPRPSPPPVGVLALDTLSNEDETPTAQAQILLPAGQTNERRLQDQDIVFVDGRLVLPPGESPRDVRVKSDARGRASVPWPRAPKAAMQEVQVRQIDAQRKKGTSDSARQFIWPKQSKLVVVDVEETLAELEPAQWNNAVPSEVALRGGATAALRSLQKQSTQVVYLALAGGDGHTLLKVRGWLASKSQGPDALPAGPLLGRAKYPSSASVGDERRDVLKRLQQQFSGEITVVVGSAEAAQVSRDLGLRTLVLGENGLDWKGVK